MYEKDYILRMIEMLGDLLRSVFALIAQGDMNRARVKLDETYYGILRKDAGFFHRLPPEEMTHTLIVDHNYTNNHLLILAELLFAEGKLEEAMNNPAGSRLCYRKSLLLYEFLDKAERTYSEERMERMEVIRKKLD